MQVNIVIANYCTHVKKKDSRADIWIGKMTELFDDTEVVVEFWPQLTVIRDLEKNPLKGCLSELNLEVTPASQEIDEYLPIQGFWPKN